MPQKTQVGIPGPRLLREEVGDSKNAEGVNLCMGEDEGSYLKVREKEE